MGMGSCAALRRKVWGLENLRGSWGPEVPEEEEERAPTRPSRHPQRHREGKGPRAGQKGFQVGEVWMKASY